MGEVVHYATYVGSLYTKGDIVPLEAFDLKELILDPPAIADSEDCYIQPVCPIDLATDIWRPELARRYTATSPRQLAPVGLGASAILLDVDLKDCIPGSNSKVPWANLDHSTACDIRSKAESLAKAMTAQRGVHSMVYSTKHGLRIVFLLPVRFLIGLTGKTYKQEIQDYQAISKSIGLPPDPRCSDWTRLYRLPYAGMDVIEFLP